MNPATIAIIPLVLVFAGCWAAFLKANKEDGGTGPDLVAWTTVFTVLATCGVVGVAYLCGVVYFNSWEF